MQIMLMCFSLQREELEIIFKNMKTECVTQWQGSRTLGFKKFSHHFETCNEVFRAGNIFLNFSNRIHHQ